MIRRVSFIAAVITLLIGFASLSAGAQSGRAFYIDYSGGSNSNNGTSKSTPWKTHPYMQTSSSCTGSGSAPAYTHAAGDQFIFKGGDTWPAACFQMHITAGGTPGAPDYYGVDKSWYSGGSWARPIFDAAQTVPSGGHFILSSSVGYITIDNFEMKNQNIAAGSGYGTDEAIQAYGASGVIVENVYIHDFMTSAQLSSSWIMDYGAGGILGYVTLLNSTIDDTNGFGFNSSGVKITGGGMGGACENCKEVSNSKFVKVMAACFGVMLCHDSEFTGVNQALFDNSTPSGYGPLGGMRPHTQAIEDENAIGGFTVYNNWVHDNYAGINIFVGYKGSQVYNNVLTHNTNNYPIGLATTAGDTPGTRGYISNNTVDCDGGGIPALGIGPYGGDSSIAGQLIVENNLAVNCPAGVFLSTATGTVVQDHNHLMSPSEAATYGFMAANKYAPSGSDASIVGQGVNLTSSCTGNLAALCFDTSGASWFGASFVGRPDSSAWAIGAFQAVGDQSSSQPNPPTNLTAVVQ